MSVELATHLLNLDDKLGQIQEIFPLLYETYIHTLRNGRDTTPLAVGIELASHLSMFVAYQ